jgi:hypothetical protein
VREKYLLPAVFLLVLLLLLLLLLKEIKACGENIVTFLTKY